MLDSLLKKHFILFNIIVELLNDVTGAHLAAAISKTNLCTPKYYFF